MEFPRCLFRVYRSFPISKPSARSPDVILFHRAPSVLMQQEQKYKAMGGGSERKWKKKKIKSMISSCFSVERNERKESSQLSGESVS